MSKEKNRVVQARQALQYVNRPPIAPGWSYCTPEPASVSAKQNAYKVVTGECSSIECLSIPCKPFACRGDFFNYQCSIACCFDKDFMSGSPDSMITLEKRGRGIERVVEDMARDLALSAGRRGNNFSMGFEGSSGRLGKYNGLGLTILAPNLAKGDDGPAPFY